jgi:hypothetical protein
VIFRWKYVNSNKDFTDFIRFHLHRRVCSVCLLSRSVYDLRSFICWWVSPKLSQVPYCVRNHVLYLIDILWVKEYYTGQHRQYNRFSRAELSRLHLMVDTLYYFGQSEVRALPLDINKINSTTEQSEKEAQ